MTVQRRLGLDVLKGASILLVVFNHALLWPMRRGDLTSAFLYGIAYGSVAAFSAVAGYVQGFHPPREEGSLIRKRAGQLLVPWLIWAPLYAVFPLVWSAIGGGALPLGTDPGPWARQVLLGGVPLWFLPVLFVVTAYCGILDTRTKTWWPAAGALGVYLAFAAACYPLNVSPLDLGNGTLWAVAPLYAFALWFGLRISRDGAPDVPQWVLIAVVALSMIGGGAITLVRQVHAEWRWLMWLPYGVGLVGGCAALLLAAGKPRGRGSHSRGARALARMGEMSLGIYILHPLLVAPGVLLSQGRGGALVGALTTAVALGVGVPLVAWLRSVPVLRRAV